MLLLVFGFSTPSREIKIDAESFDYELLENLVVERINDLRIQRKLKPLVNDSTLQIAAKAHCDYMVREGKLSHMESGDKSMQTPQKRAEYFGLEGYWVGENILYTFFNSNVNSAKNKSFQTYTYDELANAILHSWKSSSGHYQNIIQKDYSIAGLAISVDFKTKKVYACQDFGKLKRLP